jgi:cyclophilin family peptidyl-prolyl cis-trans isomerase
MSPRSSRQGRRRDDVNQRLARAQAEQRKARRVRWLLIGVGIALAIALAVGLVVLLVKPDSSSSAHAQTRAEKVTAADFGNGPCPGATSARKVTFSEPPRLCIDLSHVYTATVTTSQGRFTIKLDPTEAPITVNNFIVLAGYHYYDDTPIHRIIPGYVIQGGDATGKPPGTGSPGYTIPDEFPHALSDFTRGAVAMANTGAPNSGASQFFIWMGPNQLPSSNYSLFGQVIAGFDTLTRIEHTGTPSGTPTTTTKIVSIDLGEAKLSG